VDPIGRARLANLARAAIVALGVVALGLGILALLCPEVVIGPRSRASDNAKLYLQLVGARTVFFGSVAVLLGAAGTALRAASARGLKWLEELPTEGWVVLLATAALVPRVAWVMYMPAEPTSDCATYEGLGLSLAQGKGYQFPPEFPAPTAFRVPLYPVFLAAIYRIWGHETLAVKLAHVFLGMLTVWLSYRIAREQLPSSGSRSAALLVALCPDYLLTTSLLLSENLATPLFLFSLWCLLLARPQSYSPRWTLLSGFALGLAILAHPLTILTPVAALGWWCWSKAGWRQILRSASAYALGLVLVVLPWVVRNQRVVGYPTLSTEGGGALYWQNRPGSLPAGFRYEWLKEEVRGARGIALDEVDLHRSAFRLGFQSILQHPASFAARAVCKLRQLVHPSCSYAVVLNLRKLSRPLRFPLLHELALNEVCRYYYLALFICGGLGLLESRVRRPVDRLSFLVILGICGVCVLFLGDPRYRYPMIPLVAVFAASWLRARLGVAD